MDRAETAQRSSPADAGKDGRAMLHALINEAQRFHDSSPTSNRRTRHRRTHAQPRRRSSSDAVDSLDSSASDDASLPSGGSTPPETTVVLEPWDCVRCQLDHFWFTDPGSATSKYNRAKHWLTAMFLWETERTWEDVERATPEVSHQLVVARQSARLAALPPGRLFF